MIVDATDPQILSETEIFVGLDTKGASNRSTILSDDEFATTITSGAACDPLIERDDLADCGDPGSLQVV